MAEWKNLTEILNYQLTNGQTVDLYALIDTYTPELGWVAPAKAPEIGTVAYVDAMGQMRRGVVTKTTRTKTYVAVTTQGAVNDAGRRGSKIRVQIVIADTNYVRVAPAPVVETQPEPVQEIEADQELTLHSHGGKVEVQQEDEPEGDDEMSTETAPAETREATGSAVVKLMERVHERIRQNHPEVPAVVIVTGAGTTPLGGKWGHFRPQGWTTGDASTQVHEMFMAGETLAKGAKQVLQTMLHESAHALAETRGQQDTSRQGRWHNKTFLTIAQEMGLEYRKDKANPQIGYSEVVLTDVTVDEYADLLAALDAEIHLMVKLPFWLGGTKTGEGDDGEDGGENMGRKPKGTPVSTSGNVKCVCRCDEPNIIRMSRKVLDQRVVNCGDCDNLFTEA